MKKIIITSGYFNPIHIGHMNLFKEAKSLGDFLVVIVNNDMQVKVKGSMPFMAQQERLAIVKNIKHVDDVFLSIDSDKSIAKSLEFIAKKHKGELYFAKGGDRNSKNTPEEEKLVCQNFNIKIVNGVGGSKIQSSSGLLDKIKVK